MTNPKDLAEKAQHPRNELCRQFVTQGTPCNTYPENTPDKRTKYRLFIEYLQQLNAHIFVAICIAL